MRFIGHCADSLKVRSHPVLQANPRQFRDNLKLEIRQALPGMWERPKPPNFRTCHQARCGLFRQGNHPLLSDRQAQEIQFGEDPGKAEEGATGERPFYSICWKIRLQPTDGQSWRRCGRRPRGSCGIFPGSLVGNLAKGGIFPRQLPGRVYPRVAEHGQKSPCSQFAGKKRMCSCPFSWKSRSWPRLWAGLRTISSRPPPSPIPCNSKK